MSEDAVISAAGGNATAIRVVSGERLNRLEMLRQAAIIDADQRMRQLGVEQVGFLFPKRSHFEMAGGEFCGNATRAAALLLSRLNGLEEVGFTVSGFSGEVMGRVLAATGNRARVRCRFLGMAVKTSQARLATGHSVTVVDLEGIVHVLIRGALPEDYEVIHRSIVTQLRMSNRDAVGVIWCRREPARIRIDPVVWVKEANTFYYESSCGSGSIAAAAVFSLKDIVQPTGQVIHVWFEKPDGIATTVLESEMEVL